ncbi:LysM peptidoglycan-binding domain-containing protein [Mucilaginibacter mali]|uniref:LysM peptidoglycan-binding domain-containing protein n=1 Tax=Mucilaginibacter mali TaxID=2740462 RepID=A0A7D4TTR1_9SPHI|nr:LysM peptidoglycan-binding domain-containing protein [Mucilaginibacter mali]QKJ29295.1 LysM peptidoglycan-binding domain-containing protein [Mucilaginibacter mali]
MRFKLLVIIFPLLLSAGSILAKNVVDSVGVENLNGKKVILYKVGPKETYYGISQRYHAKVGDVIQFNNNVVLQPGMVMKVPTDMPFAQNTAKPAIAEKKPEVKYTMQQFRVAPGETLYSIAKRFGTTVDDIKATNNLKSDVLTPGETLQIRTVANAAAKTPEKEAVAENKPAVQAPPVTQQTKPVVQPPVSQPQQTVAQTQVNTNQPVQNAPVDTRNTQQYKVSAGETLFTIAKRFGTSVEDIIALNKLPNNNLQPNQILVVRSGMPPAPEPVKPKPQDVVIAKRDTTNVAGIADSLDRHIPANRYGLFLKDEKGPATWMDDPSFDPKKQLVLHRTAPIGTVMKITNLMTGRSVFAKVAGRFADNENNKDVIVVVTKNVADMIGAVDKRFRVDISYGVPNDQQ